MQYITLFFLIISILGCSTSQKFKVGECITSEVHENAKVRAVAEPIMGRKFYRLSVYSAGLKYGAPFSVYVKSGVVENRYKRVECLD